MSRVQFREKSFNQAYVQFLVKNTWTSKRCFTIFARRFLAQYVLMCTPIQSTFHAYTPFVCSFWNTQQAMVETLSDARSVKLLAECLKVAIWKIFPPVSQRRFWRDDHTIWRLQGKCWMLLKCHALRSFIFFLKTNQTKNFCNYTPSTWLQSRRGTSTPESSESLVWDKALISFRPSGKSHHYEAHRSNPSCKLLESEISIINRDGKVWTRLLCKERCYSFS